MLFMQSVHIAIKVVSLITSGGEMYWIQLHATDDAWQSVSVW
jgi:hypothetical protein